MEASGGGVVRAGGGGIGNRAADDADHGQAPGQRRLAAERQLNAMALPMLSSAAIFMRALAQNSRQPPAWVAAAREAAGEPVLLRARLYGFLNSVAFVHAAAVAVVLCAYLLGAVRSDHALPSVQRLFLVVFVAAAGVHSVGNTESWGGAAALFLLAVGTAAVVFLYGLGELKEFVVKIGRVLGA